MSDKTMLPNKDQVRRIVEGLFGDEALVKPAAAPLDLKGKAVVAKYAGDGESLHRLVVCDVAFANNAGAALTMISPGVVADAIKANEVPDNILDNFREVMNIFVNLFHDTAREHLVLNGIQLPNQPAEDAVQAALTSPVERTDFEVTVPRYGTGKMTLLAC